jgi:hypothetical protein
MNAREHERRIEPLAMMLFAVAALLGAFMLLEIAKFVASLAHAESTVAHAMRPAAAKTSAGQQDAAQMRSVVDGLKKNNLFAPPPAKQHPVNEVIGILGDEVLINGQWYKVGAAIGDAKILAIEPTKVKIVWNGQEKEFTPIAATGSGGPPGPGGRERGRGGPQPPQKSGPQMVVTGARGSGPPGMGSLSPEEQDALRERWKNMSPEEREKLRDEMRERFGRRGR